MLKLRGLNREQKAAVIHLEGPMVVVAGAGTGKTRTIAYRAAFLLEHGIAPGNLLCITFTNKAAREMRERIGAMVGDDTAATMQISTIHSLCVRILREDFGELGRDPGFTIFDSSDQLGLVRKALVENGLDPNEYDPRAMLWRIGGVKNAYPDFPEHELGDPALETAIRAYNQLLAENNAVDFDDLLIFASKLLERKKTLKKYQDRFRFIMVDEYQDVNGCQYELIRLLAARERNLYVVGDDDQSIYGWRGAQVRNILNFEQDFKGARLVKLERNYRSTGTIIKASNSVIANNSTRRDKKLTTGEEMGEPVGLIEADDDMEEAAAVIAVMEADRHVNGRRFGDYAILYRTNAQSRLFEEKLIQNGIAYIMVGGTRFFERREIKDVTAYLRVAVNPGDDLSLMRVVNFPPRGIGKKSLERVQSLAVAAGSPLFEALPRALGDESVSAQAREGIERFLGLMAAVRARVDSEPLQPLEAVDALLERVDFNRAYAQACADRNEARRRFENVEELVNAVAEYQASDKRPTLQGFLDHIALMTEEEEIEEDLREDSAVLMTLHSAKGLEFKTVFIVGAEEGFLPHERSSADDEIEEERRLFYVGMTRARETLFISHATARRRYGDILPRQPSRFIAEIPADLIQAQDIEHIREARAQVGQELSKGYIDRIKDLFDE